MERTSEPVDRADPGAARPRGARLVRGDGVLRLELEPVGVAAGSRGLLGRSVSIAFAAAVLTVVTTVAAIRELATPEPSFLDSGGLVLAAFAIGCLWLFVALTAFHAFDLGRRRTTLGVVDGALLVERRGPAGTRRVAIQLADLVKVSVAHDFAVLHQRRHDVLLLDVHGREPLALLRERPLDELEWVRDRLLETISPRTTRGAGDGSAL